MSAIYWCFCIAVCSTKTHLFSRMLWKVSFKNTATTLLGAVNDHGMGIAVSSGKQTNRDRWRRVSNVVAKYVYFWISRSRRSLVWYQSSPSRNQKISGVAAADSATIVGIFEIASRLPKLFAANTISQKECNCRGVPHRELPQSFPIL